MNDDLISRSALLADLREKGFLPAIVQRSIERAPAVDAVEIPPTGVGDLSDGYHTFNELYHHRAILFSVICNNHPEIAWKSMHHNDPNSPMYDGMFIVGIETPQGQATYHYDIDPYWDMFKVKELDRAPAWDGHTPDEAIRRIELLGDVSPAADAVDAVDCVHMTNAQKIRAMSDEELAEFIRSMVDGSYNYDFACYKYTNYETHHSDPANKGIYLYKCDDCESGGFGLDVLMWLQQPAEEGDND